MSQHPFSPQGAPRPFAFDTAFDDDGGVAYQPPRIKRSFTPDEVEVLRAEAFAEGEQSAVARAEAAAAAALGAIAESTRAALTALAAVAHDHRVHSASLALACATKIADAALERFPEAPAAAALEALAREVESQPRLIVRTAANLVDKLQLRLDQVASNIGFAGQLTVKPEAMAPAAFVLDWGEGRAAFDPAAAQARVSAALEAALASEGLHAEPLIPSES